jgi:hypothetical protein
MPFYRAYRIEDGRIRSAPETFDSESDHAAITKAQQLIVGHDIELWQGSRFVTGFKASSPKSR